MNPDKTEIILGPPGTGKTTELLNILDKTLKSFPPETISFISFTRKAANEAAFRVCERFQMEREQIPLFRTMHSIAYEYLNMKGNRIVSTKDYFKIAKQAGTFISFSDKSNDRANPEGMAPGNKMLAIISRANNNEIDLKEAWEDLGGIDWPQLETFAKIYLEYKRETGKLDFDDIIKEYSKFGTIPKINVLFIDEAQDLSKAQWKMAEKLQAHSFANYVAGDDDQSIYEWAGAHTKSFIELQGKARVLSQSYRVPRSVHNISISILSRINLRREKIYKPRDNVEGSVEYSKSIFDLPVDKGQWLLLARNNKFIPYYEGLLKELGIPYVSAQKDQRVEEMISAIKSWKELLVGGMVNARKVKIMYEFMRPVERVATGAKKRLLSCDDGLLLDIKTLRKHYGLLCSDEPWDFVFDKLTEKEEAYLKSIYDHPDFYNPKVTVSTIHGAKGGEADNVAIIKDMSYQTWAGFQDHPDPEHRVWYVAVTRTKENLYLVEPETKYYYDI